MNYGMATRGVLLGLGVLALACSAGAQQPAPNYFSDLALSQPQMLRQDQTETLLADLGMPRLVDGLPAAAGLETMAFASETFLPIAVVSVPPPAPRKPKTALAIYQKMRDPKDAPAFEVKTANPIHYSGEMGAYYSHTSGRFGGDEFGNYIVGTAGTDKTQVTAGFSYQEFNGKPVRWSR
jgi:hypothetical protein